jgi:hypothetical protein
MRDAALLRRTMAAGDFMALAASMVVVVVASTEAGVATGVAAIGKCGVIPGSLGA